MEKYFDIAGLVIRISGDPEEMFDHCGVLSEFETRGPAHDRRISCSLVGTLTEPAGTCVFAAPDRLVYRCGDDCVSYVGDVKRSWADAYMRIERRGGESRLEVCRSMIRDRITPKVVLKGMEAEHLVADNGGFLLHASCICRNGRAILFTAPSGTGKSTQAALWAQLRGAEIINGDRIVVRCGSQGAEALGIPFSGSSGICKNRRMPLEAIVYLSQAEQTSITPLAGIRAFRRIWEGCSFHTWNREDVTRCMDAVRQTIETVPVWHLACTPDESAVTVLERILESR